jgi:hypothetical protein
MFPESVKYRRFLVVERQMKIQCCPKPLFPFPDPTIIFSGIREEEAAETPPSAVLTKEGTEFVLNAKESDTLQEIV